MSRRQNKKRKAQQNAAQNMNNASPVEPQGLPQDKPPVPDTVLAGSVAVPGAASPPKTGQEITPVETAKSEPAEAKNAGSEEALAENTEPQQPVAAETAPAQKQEGESAAAAPLKQEEKETPKKEVLPAKGKLLAPAAGPKTEIKETTKKKKRKLPRKRSVFGIMVASVFKLIFVVFCVCLMAGSIVAVQVSHYMAEATANDADLLDLDNLKLNLTSNIWAPNPNNPNAEAEGDYIKYQELTGPENRIWVEWKDIPQDLVNAVIAIEDREFYEHRGVSIRRTLLAGINQVIGFNDKDFGASTIEQQLVKNLTGDDETDYQRKLREMYRAWGLDARYSKQSIMEAYLNTISLSGTIGGVQAGAQGYFGKNVWELNLAQCATIAGITRAPGSFNPYVHPDSCLTRRNKVLYQMLDTGKITQQQYDAARAEPLGVKDRVNVSDGLVTNSTFSYFSDAVFNEVVEDLMAEYGYTKDAATQFIYTAGLRIEATVDIPLQQRMENVFEHGYDDSEDAFFTNLKEPWSGRKYKDRLGVKENVLDENGKVIDTQIVLPQAAMTTIDYSGAVRGVVGGIGEKSGNLMLNRATQSPRSVGSTMKPIAAYALGIDQGIITYSSMVVDSGVQPKDPRKPKRDEETGAIINDWPKNYNNKYRNTTMPVVSAIAESTNTVAVKVGLRVGIEPMYDFLSDTLEISTLVPDGNVSDKGPSALILGGLTHGITTTELAGAYQMFGNAGRFNSVHTYTRVLDSRGNVILKPQVDHTQAISPEAAYVMNRMLWAVLRSGVAPGVAATGNRMALQGDMDSIAKTGTTSDDKDRWFVGLTPYYATAVWWGYDNPKYRLEKWSPVATGNIPPLLWKTIMEEQQAGMPLKEFPEKPEGVLEAAYCAVSGERAGKYCPKGGTGYFIPDIRDAKICSLHGGGG